MPLPSSLCLALLSPLARCRACLPPAAAAAAAAIACLARLMPLLFAHAGPPWRPRWCTRRADGLWTSSPPPPPSCSSLVGASSLVYRPACPPACRTLRPACLLTCLLPTTSQHRQPAHTVAPARSHTAPHPDSCFSGPPPPTPPAAAANNLKGKFTGKGGVAYPQYAAVALETVR